MYHAFKEMTTNSSIDQRNLQCSSGQSVSNKWTKLLSGKKVTEVHEKVFKFYWYEKFSHFLHVLMGHESVKFKISVLQSGFCCFHNDKLGLVYKDIPVNLQQTQLTRNIGAWHVRYWYMCSIVYMFSCIYVLASELRLYWLYSVWADRWSLTQAVCRVYR